MALPKSWEELNRKVGYKISEPIDEYYVPMRISSARKKKRMKLAYELEEVMQGLLIEAFYAEQYGTVLPFDELNQLSQARTRSTVQSSDTLVRIREEYMDAVEDYIEIDDTVMTHIDWELIAALMILYRHSDEPYYYSADRARALAENDSNALWEYDELREAKEKGYKYKTWRTIMDGHERESHAELNGTKLPLEEPFEAQGGYLMHPHDGTLGCADSELANCRCSLTYS